MKISKYLAPERVVRLNVPDKNSALEMVSHIVSTTIPDLGPAEIRAALQERERIMSTGIGRGLAVPHVELIRVRRMILTVAVLEHPIVYDSLDDKPVNLIFAIVAPTGAHVEYLKLLAAIVKMIKNDALRGRLLGAPSAAEIYGVLKEY